MATAVAVAPLAQNGSVTTRLPAVRTSSAPSPSEASSMNGSAMSASPLSSSLSSSPSSSRAAGAGVRPIESSRPWTDDSSSLKAAARYTSPKAYTDDAVEKIPPREAFAKQDLFSSSPYSVSAASPSSSASYTRKTPRRMKTTFKRPYPPYQYSETDLPSPQSPPPQGPPPALRGVLIDDHDAFNQLRTLMKSYHLSKKTVSVQTEKVRIYNNEDVEMPLFPSIDMAIQSSPSTSTSTTQSELTGLMIESSMKQLLQRSKDVDTQCERIGSLESHIHSLSSENAALCASNKQLESVLKHRNDQVVELHNQIELSAHALREAQLALGTMSQQLADIKNEVVDTSLSLHKQAQEFVAHTQERLKQMSKVLEGTHTKMRVLSDKLTSTIYEGDTRMTEQGEMISNLKSQISLSAQQCAALEELMSERAKANHDSEAIARARINELENRLVEQERMSMDHKSARDTLDNELTYTRALLKDAEEVIHRVKVELENVTKENFHHKYGLDEARNHLRHTEDELERAKHEIQERKMEASRERHAVEQRDAQLEEIMRKQDDIRIKTHARQEADHAEINRLEKKTKELEAQLEKEIAKQWCCAAPIESCHSCGAGCSIM